MSAHAEHAPGASISMRIEQVRASMSMRIHRAVIRSAMRARDAASSGASTRAMARRDATSTREPARRDAASTRALVAARRRPVDHARANARARDGATTMQRFATRVLIIAVVLVLALVVLARPAHAQPDIAGGAQLHYELEGLHAYDHADMDVPSARDFVLAGARLHGFIGGKWIGFHVGLDLAAGGTIHGGGFAYDVSLFPVGVALRFADTSFLTLGVGVGASGATATIDDAATLPVEARFEVGRGIRVLGRARATFVAASDSRQDGARFADELEAMLALRIGRAYTDWGYPTGNGYFVGATYREALDAKFAGIVIGYSVDMGSPRRRIDRSDEMTCENCD